MTKTRLNTELFGAALRHELETLDPHPDTAVGVRRRLFADALTGIPAQRHGGETARELTGRRHRQSNTRMPAGDRSTADADNDA